MQDYSELLIFFGLLALILPFISIILSVVSLNKIKKIEQSLFSETKISTQQINSIVQEKEDVTQGTSPVETVTYSIQVGMFDIFVNWLKEDWILKIGAFLILSGFGWFTSYAFINDWVGPQGRILIGILIGTLILIFGTFRLQKFETQGGVFLALGAGTILLTVFSGRLFFDLYSPTIALIFMLIVAVYVSYISIVFKKTSISILGTIVGFIAPLLTYSPESNYVLLFSYLTIIVLGNLWILYQTHTRIINLISLIFIFLYSMPYLTNLVATDREIILLICYFLAGVFFLSTIENILKESRANITDLLTSGLNGIFIIFWILSNGTPEWRSLTLVSWMLVFAVGSYQILKITKNFYPFYLYFGVSLSMLIGATSVELEGNTLILAIISEIVILSVMSDLLLKRLNFSQFLNLLFLLPIVMLIYAPEYNYIAVIGTEYNVFFDPNYYSTMVLGLSMVGVGFYYLKEVRKCQELWIKIVNTSITIIGSFYIFSIIGQTFTQITSPNRDLAITLTLTTFSIIAIAVHFYGVAENRNVPKFYGGILLGIITFFILFVVIWGMDIILRIFTLFLIGSILLSTAFLSKYISNISKNKNI